MSCARGLLLLFFTACWPVPHGSAQTPTIQTLLTNGSTSKRINIVFFSEGYTTNEVGKYLADARNVLTRILTTPPYNAYSNFFNAFAISVASAQSGSDHYTPTVRLVNTYFNSTFDSYGSDRLLTIPPNDRNSSYAAGQGKVDALVASLMPESDLEVMIVNDTQYGGSGGPTLITSVHVSAPEIAVHEMGHTFTGLGDEYETPFPGYPDVEEPNTTRQTNRTAIKWNSWILPSTPVPTPKVASNSAVVGLFEGAHYHATGWYRPKLDCKMRTLGLPFCEVCREASVLAMYGIVRPIDSVSPSTNTVTMSSASQPFNVTALRPVGGSLRFQWFTNGIAISSATNTNFTVTAQSLGPGTHAVRVEVNDPTTFVRNDPARLLRQTNTWTVTVPTPVTITSHPESQTVRAGTNVTFTVTATGTPPFFYQWRKDSADIPNATNAVLNITNVQITSAGAYTVLITNSVSAATSSVATLTVQMPQPVQFSASMVTNGQFQFTIGGDAGQRYDIEYSSTLTNWTHLATVTNTTGSVRYIDVETNVDRRFYRAIAVP